MICDGKRKWYDWFSEIGLALAVVGIGALTMGAGTVAAVALAGAGVAGAIGAAGDLADGYGHNHLDAKTVILDVAQIVGGFMGAGQALGGRLIKVAAAADEAVTAGVAGSARLSGTWANLAGLAARTYVPMTIASAGANGITLVVMTDECIAGIHAVLANKAMAPDEQRASIARIVGQFILVGGLTALAVKGDIAAVLDGKPPIEIINLNGEPIVVAAGTKPVIRPRIGDMIETDGSLTKTGKQRLAELPPDSRQKLLKLDQSTMGKVLLLDNANVAKLDDAAIQRIAKMHPQQVAALANLSHSDVAAVLALDDATMAKLGKMPPETIAKLSPITEAKVHQKIADIEAVDGNVKTQLEDIHDHLRDTDFASRGSFPDNGGNVKVLVKSKTQNLTPKAIETPGYVRLEPIPSPPAPRAVTINSIEVSAKLTAKEGGAKVTGDLAPTPKGELNVPTPSADVTVKVKTSEGDFPYTDLEKPPQGTRIAVVDDKLQKGVPGGHTRAAWNGATSKYGDAFKATGEDKIAFKLPGAKSEIKMSAIEYEITTKKGTTASKAHSPGRRCWQRHGRRPTSLESQGGVDCRASWPTRDTSM
ncbi:MAG: hypothetical protein NT062_11240 [Proteobacteria bacterium]|nr:hypothetical protein [Pseudomonadota bacterium]